jgi:Glyoxalase-like domain
MGSRLTEIVVDCHDPAAQAAFWAAALDYRVVRTEDGQVEVAPWEREPPDLADQVRQAPSVPTLVFVTVRRARRSRTVCTWTSGRSAARTRKRWSDCSLWEPGTPTWGRARLPGWSWPTRKATSSASWARWMP